MPRSARHLAAVLWLSLPLSAAQAQSRPAVLAAVPDATTLPPAADVTVPSITLAELLKRAKADPPSVLAARADLRRAQAEHSYAKSQWLPSVNGEASVGYQYDNRLVLPDAPRIDSESIETRADLTFDFTALDLARSSRIDAANAQEKAQGFAVESVQRRAVLSATELYLRAGAATQLVRDAQLTLERRSHQLQAITDLVQAGTRSPVDAQRAKVEVLSAEYTLGLRRTDERAAFAALAAAVGMSVTALLRPADEHADFSVAANSPAEARSLALDHRPELRSASERTNALRFEHDAAVAARLPTFGAQANGAITYLDVRRGAGVGGPQYGAAAGVYLRWRGLDPTVWSKGDVAAAATERGEREQTALAQTIGAEVVATYYALQRARTESQRAVAVLEAAQVAREAQNGRYLAGVASLLELLDAEDLEQEARLRRIEARRDEAVTAAQLLSVCGMLAR